MTVRFGMEKTLPFHDPHDLRSWYRKCGRRNDFVVNSTHSLEPRAYIVVTGRRSTRTDVAVSLRSHRGADSLRSDDATAPYPFVTELVVVQPRITDPHRRRLSLGMRCSSPFGLLLPRARLGGFTGASLIRELTRAIATQTCTILRCSALAFDYERLSELSRRRNPQQVDLFRTATLSARLPKTAMDSNYGVP